MKKYLIALVRLSIFLCMVISLSSHGMAKEITKKDDMYLRKGPLTLEGFKGSGADFLEQYKPYIFHKNTAITSPHKVYGPENNDLVLQLRKRGINHVILAGMSANLCVESHMRELIEQGFKVTVVSDATAAKICKRC
jgi:nicotinamidase-related amidase